MSNIPDLQPAAADTERPMPPLTDAVWTSDASTTDQLNAKCQDFITRYLGRSLITPDDPNMIHVNRKLLKLAFKVSVIVSTLWHSSPHLSVMDLSSANNLFTVPFLNARLYSRGTRLRPPFKRPLGQSSHSRRMLPLVSEHDSLQQAATATDHSARQRSNLGHCRCSGNINLLTPRCMHTGTVVASTVLLLRLGLAAYEQG